MVRRVKSSAVLKRPATGFSEEEAKKEGVVQVSRAVERKLFRRQQAQGPIARLATLEREDRRVLLRVEVDPTMERLNSRLPPWAMRLLEITSCQEISILKPGRLQSLALVMFDRPVGLSQNIIEDLKDCLKRIMLANGCATIGQVISVEFATKKLDCKVTKISPSTIGLGRITNDCVVAFTPSVVSGGLHDNIDLM